MKSSLTALVFALVLLAATGAGYGWWYHLVAGKTAEAATLSLEIASKMEAKDRAAAARAALAGLSISESAVSGYFVSEDTIVSFLSDLQGLGRGLGATVSVLSVSATSGKAPAPLTVSLQVSGSFDAVSRTVGAIEYAPYAITVQALGLSQGADTSKGALTWGATLTLSVGTAAAATSASSKPL